MNVNVSAKTKICVLVLENPDCAPVSRVRYCSIFL